MNFEASVQIEPFTSFLNNRQLPLVTVAQIEQTCMIYKILNNKIIKEVTVFYTLCDLKDI